MPAAMQRGPEAGLLPVVTLHTIEIPPGRLPIVKVTVQGARYSKASQKMVDR